MKTDILIVGGGTGGVAAALAACRMGRRVVMTEPTDWIGGQLTQQAVPPDEHHYIEYCGRTASYMRFRTEVRKYYQQHYPLTETARYTKPSVHLLNPGNGSVSRLCHEPRVGLAVLNAMLAPYVESKLLTILLEHKPVGADVDGDRVRSVTIESIHTGVRTTIEFQYVLDATETGELLALTKTEYVTGSEPQSETGEPHASETRRPLNMQGVTACFAIDYLPDEDHTIDKPEMYDFWRKYRPPFWPGPFLGWTELNPITLEPYKHVLFGDGVKHRSRFVYRRILDRNNFRPGSFASDITLVNWASNDYFLGPVFEVPEAEAARHIRAAKQLSLSLLYWMQTEAPRLDGGVGFRGLRLRKDIVGTEDGLAKHIYIRESRRIVAEFTIKEQHIAQECRPGNTLGEAFHDSVGLGQYRIDLHPSTEGDNYVDLATLPSSIPLGSMIPVRMENLLPACKNIGTTHITNGMYRLHPFEWNIGEATGSLAAYCIEQNTVPRRVRNNERPLRDFQDLLVKQGFELAWPELDWSRF